MKLPAPLSFALQATAQYRQQTGRSFVTLSYAQTIDGSITHTRGQPFLISGDASAQMTHALRAAHDAILVGIGTVFADDPQLTVRHVRGEHPQPIVVDSGLRFPLRARLLQHPTRPPWVFCAEQVAPDAIQSLAHLGARVFPVPTHKDGRVRLDSVLQTLAELEINSIMVEGGAQIIQGFLTAHLADYAAITLAPALLGGYKAVNDVMTTSQIPRITPMNVHPLDPDILLYGPLRYGES